MKSKSQYTTTTTDYKARTAAATVANIFAAKARHDELVEQAIARTAQDPRDEGQVLWI